MSSESYQERMALAEAQFDKMLPRLTMPVNQSDKRQIIASLAAFYIDGMNQGSHIAKQEIRQSIGILK